jgi:hypothetical protein
MAEKVQIILFILMIGLWAIKSPRSGCVHASIWFPENPHDVWYGHANVKAKHGEKTFIPNRIPGGDGGRMAQG